MISKNSPGEIFVQTLGELLPYIRKKCNVYNEEMLFLRIGGRDMKRSKKNNWKNVWSRGTIFTRRKTLSDKIANECAWARVRKYWLFMDRKSYKTSLLFYVTGVFTVFGALFAACYYLPWKIYEFFTKDSSDEEV